MLNRCISLGLIFCTSVFADQLSAAVTVSGNDVAAFVGTDQVKVVFENKGHLYLVDFANTQSQKPSIRILPQTQGAIVPNLSPDGQWIVYGKGPNGDMNNNESLKSSAFITSTDPLATSQLVTADLAHEPRFQINQMPPVVLYSTVGKWNAWNGIGQVRKKSWNGSSLGSETLLTAQGAFYGGYDGQYLASSSQFGVIYEPGNPGSVPDTAISYSLFKASTNELNHSARQVCNVSLSPSSQYKGSIMGLDFGSAGRTNDSINGGSPWGLHDILLIASPEGQLLKTILRPNSDQLPGIITTDDSYNAGKQHWDDPEWTNHPYFAVANLQVSRSFLNSQTGDWESTDNHERIFLINIKESTFLEIIRSNDLSQQSTNDMQWPVAHIQLPPNGLSEASHWLTTAQTPINGYSATLPLANRITIKQGVLNIHQDWNFIEIFNMNGQSIHTFQTAGKESMNLNDYLSTGSIYLIKITKLDHSNFSKLISL